MWFNGVFDREDLSSDSRKSSRCTCLRRTLKIHYILRIRKTAESRILGGSKTISIHHNNACLMRIWPLRFLGRASSNPSRRPSKRKISTRPHHYLRSSLIFGIPLSTAVGRGLCRSSQDAELTTTCCKVEHLAAGCGIVDLGSNHDILIGTLTGLVV